MYTLWETPCRIYWNNRMVSICRFLFHCKRLDEPVLSKMAFSIFENSDGKFDKAGVDIHWNSSNREEE